MNTIGEHIRKRRAELQIGQKVVAGIIGVAENTVHLWEIDQTLIKLQTKSYQIQLPHKAGCNYLYIELYILFFYQLKLSIIELHGLSLG